MPRIQIDLPVRDLEAIEAMTGDAVWPNAEAAIRDMVSDWLETHAWTPEYVAQVKDKLAQTETSPGEGRDMDDVFDELEARLAKLASKAS
jgi:Arc/MetJ-type ribon-helix-helix transcriptional regulator